MRDTWDIVDRGSDREAIMRTSRPFGDADAEVESSWWIANGGWNYREHYVSEGDDQTLDHCGWADERWWTSIPGVPPFVAERAAILEGHVLGQVAS